MSRPDLNALAKTNPDVYARLCFAAESFAAERAPSVLRPEDAVSIVYPLIGVSDVERLAVVALSARNRVIDAEVLTVGSHGFTVVDPRQVLRWALTRKRPCAGIVVAHNHPSGDATPSYQDVDVTRRLRRACEVVGITLVDHVVVTADVRVWSRVDA